MATGAALCRFRTLKRETVTTHSPSGVTIPVKRGAILRWIRLRSAGGELYGCRGRGWCCNAGPFPFTHYVLDEAAMDFKDSAFRRMGHVLTPSAYSSCSAS